MGVLTNIDVIGRTATCNLCGSTTIRLRSDNKRWRCVTCEKNAKYGIKPGKYNEMLSKQNYRCAICNNTLVNPQIDHDHDTDKVRGLLCPRCNMALGMWNDDVDALLAAVAYLYHHLDTV